MKHSRGLCHVSLGVLAALWLAAAGCSDAVKPIDEHAPGRVTDLVVTAVTDSTVVLAWTTPGDDSGQPSRYDIRHLGAILSEDNWEPATPVESVPSVGVPGTRAEAVIRGLPPGETRYIGLKSVDAAANWSMLSNVVHATVGPPVCDIVPAEISFGLVPVLSGLPSRFTITNKGGGTLTGDVGLDCPDFLIIGSPGPFALRAGESRTVQVQFRPQGVGERMCLIETGALCGTVPASGRGGEIEFRLVPIDVGEGETFTMGSQESELGRDEDETPHPVHLTTSFEILDREVTQVEWFALMGWIDGEFLGGTRPVERITWFDAIEYCNRLSASHGLAPAYEIGLIERDPDGRRIITAQVVWNPWRDGYRLPTEAEWEYACRAGTRTAFHSGPISELGCAADPALDVVAVYCANSGATAEIGGREPNDWGLRDMHGNVYEWCWDWYDVNYGRDPDLDPEDADLDPSGPAEGQTRLARGGGWQSSTQHCRSAYRLSHSPGAAYADVGLRVVRSLP